MGYTEYGKDFIPINAILMCCRKYIFSCTKNGIIPTIYNLQIRLKEMYSEQEYISKINGTPDKFRKLWNLWGQIFQDV